MFAGWSLKNGVLKTSASWYLPRSVAEIHPQNFAEGTAYSLISIF